MLFVDKVINPIILYFLLPEERIAQRFPGIWVRFQLIYFFFNLQLKRPVQFIEPLIEFVGCVYLKHARTVKSCLFKTTPTRLSSKQARNVLQSRANVAFVLLQDNEVKM